MQDYSKLAKQPTKRSRKYNRQRKQPSFPLLSLPLELVHAVLDLVTDVDDLEALSWTCRSFYNRCRKRALLKRFAPDRIFKSLDIGLDGVLPATLYCLADAEAVDVGFKPFTIIDTIEWNGDVFLRVLEHDCTRFEEHLHTRSYLNIEWTDDRVWLAHNCVICNVVDPDDMLILTWDDEFSGSLQKMTSAMMHERFTCPECMDSQVVECGDDGFRARWPEVGAGLQNFEMPCPRCTIDFDTACEIYAMAIAARANPSLHFTPSPSPELNWPSRRTPDIPDDFRHGSPTPSLASSAYSDSDSDSDSSTWSIPSERDWAELTPILADEDEEEDVEWTEYALLRGEQQASKDRERVVEGEREVVEFEPNVECEEVEEVEVEEDGPSASPASGMTLRNEYWGDDEYGQDYGYAGSWGDEDYGPEYGWARERPSEEFEVGYDLGYGAGFEDGYEQARRDTEVWMQQGGWRSELDRAWAQGGEAARRFYEGLGYFDGEGEQEGR